MNYQQIKIVLTTEDLDNLHYLTEKEGVSRYTPKQSISKKIFRS